MKKSEINKVAFAFTTPVLRREREQRCAHFIADAGELGTLIVIPNLSRCLTTLRTSPRNWHERSRKERAS
jgi:hypothetical protein